MAEQIAKSDETLKLCSPPKLTRMVKIEKRTKPNYDKNVNNPSLPTLAGEVAVAQKNQVLRLEKRIEYLRILKEILHSRREAEKHVQAVVRKSTLLQDDIQWHQKSWEALKQDIESLVCTNSKLKRSLRDEETEIAREKRGYEEYRKKMFKHRELSALEENSNDIDVDIAEKTKYRETLEKELKDLQESNDVPRLLSGEMEEILMAEISTLEESLHELQENLKRKLEENHEKEKQDRLKHEVENLQKKNLAQITWTRKQLQETMARNKQWNEQISRKEAEIKEIRQKMDSI
ncbi:colicin-K-like [Xenia sp. Carnegie-2017]|uniref:colicin-K-like n=1 Tax=Xenia sp. Carnegie-2017 TaxID=2897299 RepID=UPI001F04A9C5|nr:colicin-K-like [Xenia sp. Carnegie-2017]